MKSPDAVQEPQSVESLLESFGALSHMPEATSTEARAKRDAYNSAIQILSDRVSTVHMTNETGSGSIDDSGPEEAADNQDRDLLAPALQEFHGELARLHDVIVRFGEQK